MQWYVTLCNKCYQSYASLARRLVSSGLGSCLNVGWCGMHGLRKQDTYPSELSRPTASSLPPCHVQRKITILSSSDHERSNVSLKMNVFRWNI